MCKNVRMERDGTSGETGQEDAEREQRRKRAWLSCFGFEPPTYEDEGSAPPTDETLIRAFARRELPRSEIVRVFELVLRYRSWAEAISRVEAGALRESYE